MQRPRLLWIRTAEECTNSIARSTAAEHFEIQVCPDIATAQTAAQSFSAQVVCFDFEHPQVDHLRAMRDFKVAYPSLPLLMLTTQHSESLAVWAFRARVWNYLVKPVAASELRANFTILTKLVGCDREPPRRQRLLGTFMPDSCITSPDPHGEGALQPAIRQVEKNYGQKLRQSVVAAACGLSVCSFSRAFKAHYGLTFREYLMRYRIGRACRMLREGTHSATSVGMAVGFEDASHFSRAFRKLLGVSPTTFQRLESLRVRSEPSSPAETIV